MEKMVSKVYGEIENLFHIRKTYEEQIKALENTIKENNKDVRQINKELKEVEKDSKEAMKLKEKKEAIATKQKEIQTQIPNLQVEFEENVRKNIENVVKGIETASYVDNGEFSTLEEELRASHEEENNRLLEVQNKIEGLEKLNRAEMPDSFRERLQSQIKELLANKQSIQTSFEQKRELIQVKLEELKRTTGVADNAEGKQAIEEIVEAMQKDDWKKAEKLWKPLKKEMEKNMEIKETIEEIEELPNTPEEKAEENNQGDPFQEIAEEPVKEISEVEEVVENKEEKAEGKPGKVKAIYIDMLSEKIYADIGENDSKDYNFEVEMNNSMLDKQNKINTLRKHVPNFDRIAAEKERNEASEKSEEDYNRYIEIFEKVDPFVLVALNESHDDFKQYLKAVKNGNKEDMPCELYYNLQKITKANFAEVEQDEIIENIEKNAKLATQVRGLKQAKRARKWRKFESKHSALHAIMSWLRMEENVKQLTESK